MQDDIRQPVVFREVLVLVNLVLVAGSAGVLDTLLSRRVFEERWKLRAFLDILEIYLFAHPIFLSWVGRQQPIIALA